MIQSLVFLDLIARGLETILNMTNFEALIYEKKQIFTHLANSWQQTTQGELALFLSNGKLIKLSQGQFVEMEAPYPFPSTWSVQKGGDENLIGTALKLEGSLVAYLLSYNTSQTYLRFLEWVALGLLDQLKQEQALQGVTDELISAWNQLDLVYRIMQTLGEQSNLLQVLTSIINEVIKVLGVEAGFILLSPDSELYTINGQQEYVISDKVSINDLRSQVVRKSLLNVTELTLLNEPRLLAELMSVTVPLTWHNIILVPIPTGENEPPIILGVLNKFVERGFTAGDGKLVTAVAEQVGAIINNFKLQAQLISQERVRRELEIAAEIQESMLLKTIPEIRDLQIDVSTSPVYEVGGDFYDFVSMDDNHLTVVIGDVAGKGIPSAMFTPMIRTVLRMETHHSQEPHLIIKKVNEVLRPDLEKTDLFITALVVTLNTKNSVLMYANAGHVPGLIYHAHSKTSRFLKATSTPIGVFEHNYKTTKYIHIADGDTLVLFSDGLSDAKNQANEPFGRERIKKLVHQYADKSPNILRQILLKELNNFSHPASIIDDVTIVVVKFSMAENKYIDTDEYDVVRVIPFEYVADTTHLTEISALVTQACRDLEGLPADSKGDDFVHLVELAVSEICTNVMEHAYAEYSGELRGQISLTSVGIQIDLYDQGSAFDPNSVPPPIADPLDPTEGGYGLHIVRQNMDVAEYENTEQGNHWCLVKYLTPS